MLFFFSSPMSSEKTRQCCRNCNHRVQRKLPKIFRKTVMVSIFSSIQQIFFRSFFENFSAGLSKLLFMCSEDLHWVEDSSNRKIVLTLSYSEFEQYEFVFCWTNSDIPVRIAFYMSRGKFWVFFRENLCLFCFLVFDRELLESLSENFWKVP